MRNVCRFLFAASLVTVAAAPAAAQNPATQPRQVVMPEPPQMMLPPATRLEGFMPTIGAITTVGYEVVGRDSSGVDALGPVTVETREMRDANGQMVRGLIVEVTESATVRAHSFVDVDEIPGLLKGLDTLLQVIQNPTPFDHFEMRYMTKGELVLTTGSNAKGVLHYGVEAGRLSPARVQLDMKQMGILRGLFATGLDRLNATAGR